MKRRHCQIDENKEVLLPITQVLPCELMVYILTLFEELMYSVARCNGDGCNLGCGCMVLMGKHRETRNGVYKRYQYNRDGLLLCVMALYPGIDPVTKIRESVRIWKEHIIPSLTRIPEQFLLFSPPVVISSFRNTRFVSIEDRDSCDGEKLSDKHLLCMPMIEHLQLGKYACISPDSILRLRNLTSLGLEWGQCLHEELALMTHISELYLDDARISGENVSTLTNLRALTVCCDDEQTMTDQYLTGLTGLESLDVSWSPGISDDGISKLTNLTSLRFDDAEECLTNQSIACLTNLRTLDIEIYENEVTTEILRTLTNLTNLRLKGDGSSTIRLDELTTLRKLRYINLDNCGNESNEMTLLGNNSFPDLEYFSFSACDGDHFGFGVCDDSDTESLVSHECSSDIDSGSESDSYTSANTDSEDSDYDPNF